MSGSTTWADDDLPGLRVITLTGRNKRYLLQDAINASRRSMAETEILMTRLEHFSLSVAVDFGFKHTAQSKAPFRLISSLGGHVKEPSPPHFESFIALSYCWHSHDWAPTESCRNCGNWPLSLLMLSGLLDQRKSPNEGVWIDACCIDQNNVAEKRHAIGAMDVVYKSARQVIIALEDISLSDEQDRLLRDTLANKFYEGSQEGYLTQEMLRRLSQILIVILSARWFTRAWCSHEMQLGVKHVFLVPTTKSIVTVHTGQLDDLYWHTFPTSVSQPDLSKAMTSISLAFDIYSRTSLMSDNRTRRSFMAEFHDISRLKSSFEIDKISISMNVVGLQLYFKGGNKSAEECKWILAMVALCAGDLTVLGGAGDALKPDTNSSTASWLHWAEDDDDDIATTSPSNLSEPCSIESIDCDQIVLDLFVIKAPTMYTPPSSYIDLAAAFLKLCISIYPTANRGFWMGFDKDSEDYRETWHSRSQIIACSLLCGLHWIMETMTLNSSLASSMQSRLDDFEGGFDLMPVVAQLLRVAYRPELSTLISMSAEQNRAVLQFFFYVLFVFQIEGGVDDMAPSQGLQDPSLSQYGVLDMGTGGKVITRNGRMNLPTDGIAYTMPVILGNSSCATIRRLWILAPVKTDQHGPSWRIVKKIRLFTLVPFKDDGLSVVRCAKQRIRGY